MIVEKFGIKILSEIPKDFQRQGHKLNNKKRFSYVNYESVKLEIE
jgi:hypothetical protein